MYFTIGIAGEVASQRPQWTTRHWPAHTKFDCFKMERRENNRMKHNERHPQDTVTNLSNGTKNVNLNENKVS